MRLLYRRLRRSIARYGLRTALVRSAQRLWRSLRNHGIGGTLKRVWQPRPAPIPLEQLPDHPFDLRHGTDTGGFLSGGQLLFDLPSGSFTVAYYGISPSTLTEALTRLPIRFEDFSFVDIGSGKGRGILVAASFPFARLIGVDFSPELCAVAHANLALKPEIARRTTILNQDATLVVFPETPLVIFLYDPFMMPVLRKVLSSLERQLKKSPRETYIVYAANRYSDEIASDFRFLKLVWEGQIPMSPEDVAVDRHELTEEFYSFYRAAL